MERCKTYFGWIPLTNLNSNSTPFTKKIIILDCYSNDPHTKVDHSDPWWFENHFWMMHSIKQTQFIPSVAHVHFNGKKHGLPFFQMFCSSWHKKSKKYGLTESRKGFPYLKERQPLVIGLNY